MTASPLELRGAFTALITPFRNGEVDEDALRRQVRFQIDGNVAGLVPVGTTGESPTVSTDEHKRIIEIVLDEAAGQVPVIPGAGSYNTKHAEEMHRFAKSVGAAAVLSVNPYYNKPTQDGLHAHFMHLSDAVDIPIVLYNIPGRCGVAMTAETIAKLFADAPIAAVKEATGDITMATRIRQLCQVPILSGDDPMTLPIMSVGGVGVISVVSNLVPAEVSKLCQLASDGKFAEAAELHHKLFGLTTSVFLDGNPAGVKHAMQRLGRDSGEIRLPLVPVTTATGDTIDDELRTLKMLS